MKKIALNVGHGGEGKNYDSGAVSQCKTHEHIFNRNVLCPIIKKELESLGYEVIVVIQKKSFGELADRINKINPDLILSVHSNAFDGLATGSEVLFWRRSSKGQKLAKLLQNGIVSALGLADRGVKGLINGERGSALLRDTKAVSVILEPFFIDNEKDFKVAKDNVDLLGRNIAMAVQQYFNL